MFFPSFTKSHIAKIKDVWNIETETFYSNQIIFDKLIYKGNWICEYNLIKKSIPTDRINELRNASNPTNLNNIKIQNNKIYDKERKCIPPEKK